jgi:hypothetical protein
MGDNNYNIVMSDKVVCIGINKSGTKCFRAARPDLSTCGHHRSQEPSCGDVGDKFFDMIFDVSDGYKPSCTGGLDETKFTELIDANKLAFIANNKNLIFKNLRESARDAVDFEELWQSTHGKNNFCVEYTQDPELMGRYQARGARSGQGLLREARYTVYDEFYNDCDMVNAHPVIVLWLCENLKIKSVYLSEYVASREKHLAQLIGVNPGMTRDKAKQIFLSIQYGGSADFNRVSQKTRFLVDYKNELEGISSEICEKMSYFKDISDKRAEKSGKTHNLFGKALSHICCYVENQLLMAIYDRLNSKSLDVQNCVLCFDGIMIPKNLIDAESFCTEITEMFSSWSIPMAVKCKPMSPIDLAEFGYNPELYYECVGKYHPLNLSGFYEFDVEKKYAEMICKTDGTSESRELVFCQLLTKLIGLLPRELIRFKDDTRYSQARDLFDGLKDLAIWFRKCFAIIDSSTGMIVVKERSSTGAITFATKGLALMHNFSISSVGFLLNNKVEHVSISSAISNASKELSYDCITVTPHNPKNRFEKMEPELGFSLAASHIHDYDSEFKVDMAIVNVWLDHMREVICDGDEKIYNYLLQWFAHILSNPRVKTGVVPLVKSAPGCGKNVFVTVFTDYILNQDLTIVTSDAEKIASRFNGISEGKIFLCLDEAVDSWNRALNNKMKNFITEPKRVIEKKGLESYTVSDYSNYMYTTNNDFASIIEEGDRRYVCISANSKYKGDREYFDNFVNKLHNMEAGRHLFHYLLSLDLSDFDVRKIPQTTYKKELASKQADSAIEFLIALRHKMMADADSESVDSDDGFGIGSFGADEFAVPASELYNIYKEWCEHSRSKMLPLRIFGRSVVGSGIESKKTKRCNVYILSPDLIEGALGADYDLS